MKVFIALPLFFATLLIGGCAVAPSQTGFAIIGETTEPLTATNSTNASKTGTSCGYNVLGIVAGGDFSIQTAKADGKITNVATVDKNITNILGLYSKVCTVVTGS